MTRHATAAVKKVTREGGGHGQQARICMGNLLHVKMNLLHVRMEVMFGYYHHFSFYTWYFPFLSEMDGRRSVGMDGRRTRMNGWRRSGGMDGEKREWIGEDGGMDRRKTGRDGRSTGVNGRRT